MPLSVCQVSSTADGDLMVEWDIDDATNGDEAEDYGITAETSDERLDEIAVEITRKLAEVSTSTVVVVHGLEDHLREPRDDLGV